MPALRSKQVKLRLKALPHWSKRAQTIVRTYKFEAFLQGIDFVGQVAKKAQKMNHHPDVDIRFDQMTLTFTTQDSGGITAEDFSLAKQCDEIFSTFSVSGLTQI